MILRHARIQNRWVWLVVGTLLLPTCSGVDLTAPNDSSLTVSANPTTIGLNGGESTITVILTNPDGSPVPDGTAVYLTSTLGTIAQRGETQGSRLNEKLVAGNQPGTATVTARSGTDEVSATVDVTIGSTLVSITLSANPASLPPDGGKSTITAVAYGQNFETLENVAITFSTDAGTLESEGSPIRTNSKGEARDTLTTTASANVNAASGAEGEDVSATATVEVGANETPTAKFTASPLAPKVSETVSFSAAESVDPDGSITSYRWDFGDGGVGSGVRTSHIYQSVNSFSVVLVVTDDLGAEGSQSQTIRVGLGDSPVASFLFSPAAPSAGTAITFDAGSSFDPDGDIVRYTWNWGDGSSPVIEGIGDWTATHTFATAGDYDVTLTVTDDLNNSDTTVQKVTINP